MAPRVIKHLSDIEIDEISLVPRGANQHAKVSIAKRAPEEENMPDLYNEDGVLLPEDIELEEGDVVFDESGQAYEFVLDEGEYEEEEPELAVMGKSFPFGNPQPVQKTFRDEFMEELSKAYTDEERDQVISKAFDVMQQYAEEAEQYGEVAKAERDLRLTREYISKAAEYNVPIDPEELGPVLYRMAETMDYNDCAVIHKALVSSGSAIFDEVGYIGGGDNTDVMSQVSAFADQQVQKADVNQAELIAKTFDMNPEAYDQYLAEQRGF